MFDVGFTEILLIGVVTLLVVGPERLPRVARAAGLWFGKARGFLASVKADIDNEIKADELRRILDEQAKSSGIHEIVEETRSAVDDLRQASDEQAAQWSEQLAATRARATASAPEPLVKAQDDTAQPGSSGTPEKP